MGYMIRPRGHAPWNASILTLGNAMRPSWIIAALLLSAAGPLAAADDAVPEPPDLPPTLESGHSIEPEVTILETDKGRVTEYRVRGRLYMVRIQPVVGPAYFLLDTDGDGELDVREDDPRNISIPQWILLRW